MVEPQKPILPDELAEIRQARSHLRPVGEDILPIVTKEYNTRVGKREWVFWAERCAERSDLFEEASELLLYDVAFIAGFAMIESGGCQMGVVGSSGERGMMQIYKRPPRKRLARIAELRGKEVKEVDWKEDPMDNLLAGLLLLGAFEEQLASRPHGILAYNMGAAGEKRAMRKAGWSKAPWPSVATLMPHLRYDRKAKPRVYVQRVLAAGAIMKRTLGGQVVEKVDSLTRRDIPGFDPADDGDVVLAAYQPLP